MYLNFTINPVSLMKLAIEREAMNENNSDMEVKVNTEKIITSIFKGNTMTQDMLNSQIHLIKHRGGVSPRSKCPWVRYVCPILNLWKIISSRRGIRNKLLHSLLVQSNAACSLFRAILQNSNVVATALVPEYLWVICNPNDGQSS